MDERAQEINRLFQNSWEETKLFYDDLIENYGWKKLIPLREFIVDLMNSGESDYYRSGTSMHYLILSRSVNFGLRDDQKNLRIGNVGIDQFRVQFSEGGTIYREFEIQNFSDIRMKNLLKTLKDTLID
jgi:hypothetical protein